MSGEKSKQVNTCGCRPLGRVLSDMVMQNVQKNSQAPQVTYIRCNASEDSYALHEIYKERVKGTEPDPEKMAHIHDKVVRRPSIRKSQFGDLDRRPSILECMNHCDEGEVVHDVHETHEVKSEAITEAEEVDNTPDDNEGNTNNNDLE